MANYEGMDAKTFNELFLERLDTSPNPKVEVKNSSLRKKMMEFGYRRVAVQDAHPNEPVCRVCLAVGYNKGIEDEYCPECRVNPTSRLLRSILDENKKEGEEGPSKLGPSKFGVRRFYELKCESTDSKKNTIE